ncbi:MAG: hypothetical protein KC996_05155 [Phycisphaerales bacterium]|nr:hypothetical protein [Phycisphaerales bacterium]
MKLCVLGLVLSMVSACHALADEISLFIVTGQSNARPEYAMGVDSGLRASGLWDHVVVFNSQRSGNALYKWVEGSNGDFTHASNYTEDLWAADGSSALQRRIAELEDEGHTVRVEGMFWFQGEADSANVSQQNQYQQKLTWMLQDLWSRYGKFDVVLTVIDWNHDMPDYLAFIGRTPEDVEAIRGAIQRVATSLDLGILDSRDRVRADIWHIADATDPRGFYAVATDFGADEARIMIERSRCEGDLTGDGVLDIFDIFAMLEIFSTGCR